MFGIVAYIGECFGFAVLVTLIYMLAKPLKNRDEVKSWKVLLNTFVVALIVPYSAVEVATRTVGKSMKATVEEAVSQSEFEGDLDYYKVTSYNGKSARVVAIGTIEEPFVGDERVVMAMTLTRDGDSWTADSYRFVASNRHNTDGWSFPPYW